MIQSDNRRIKEMDNISRDDRGRDDRGRYNKGRNNRRMVDEGIIQAAIIEKLFFRRIEGGMIDRPDNRVRNSTGKKNNTLQAWALYMKGV
jgi:hypothetical protein